MDHDDDHDINLWWPYS